MSREPREPHEPRQPIPQPPPTPTPQPTRLGNPSVSNMISFTFSETRTTNMLPAEDVPEPFPPILGGEDTILRLSSDELSYVWGETAHVMALLQFKSEYVGLANRPIGFNIDGETFVVKTGAQGTATVNWKPFGVPAPGQPERVFRAYAFFLGY